MQPDDFGVAALPSGMSIVVYLAVWAVLLFVGYWVIRLAVRHGVMDANRRAGSGEVGRSFSGRAIRGD